MKRMCLIVWSVLFSFLAFAAEGEKHLPDVISMAEHPRLLLLDKDIPQIKSNVSNSREWGKIHRLILEEADKMLQLEPVERIKTGRRLLAVSREALRRIFYLSYAWRMTGDEAYSKRAEKEMRAVASFSDWNPSHFLDVAEMTLGMSIGYDWLYSRLSEDSKQAIRQAIVEKGLNPSFDDSVNDWLRSSHNWNQVCNTGMAYGAIAVYESMPDTAKAIVERAIASIRLPMQKYAPDGAYPEGFTYWSYGTSFNVMFLSALETLFGTDYGLSALEGFLPSAVYIQNMIGPSGENFNYGDSDGGSSLNPTLFWFAEKTHDSSVLWSQPDYLESPRKVRALRKNRLLPAIMVWGKDIDWDKISHSAENVWVGQGVTPVASMRTSWTDSDAVFVGFKAGRAGSNHSHMDVGSFVMEAEGVRWAVDLGPQDYNSLESVGIDLWNRKQDSQRWDVFRYNNYAHNTLTFDGKKQNVNGYASVDRIGKRDDFMFVVSDLAEVYKGQIGECRRGVAIVGKTCVVVRDEMKATDSPVKFTWTMLTGADVKKVSGSSLLLSQKGKKLKLSVSSDMRDLRITCSPARSGNSYDADNEGITMVRVEGTIPADARRHCNICLFPGGRGEGCDMPLEEWK